MTSAEAKPLRTYLVPQSEWHCTKCQKKVFYHPPASSSATIEIQCANCKSVHSVELKKPSVPSKSLYTVLKVEETASAEDIRRSYRKLASRCHPDKVPNKKQEWEELSKAYGVLSDPSKRRWYDLELKGKLQQPQVNSNGAKENGANGLGAANLEAFFHEIFGGERFEEFVGKISIGREMAEAISKNEVVDSSSDGKESDAEREKAEEREIRIKQLTDNLQSRLASYVIGATNAASTTTAHDDEDDTEDVRLMRRREIFRQRCMDDAEELSSQRYGIELLHTLSFIYLSKSHSHTLSPLRTSWSTYLSTSLPSSFRLRTHLISSTITTVRRAYGVKAAFDALQKLEKQDNVSEEHKKKAEEKCAEAAMNALWSGARLEIESVVGEVCDRVLVGSSTPMNGLDDDDDDDEDGVIRRRVEALAILGEAFGSVKGESAKS